MRCVVLACLSLAAAAPAIAQDREPVGPFVVDVRGAFARHKAEPSVATDLQVEPANLPSRSFGLVGAAHVYPFHFGKVTLGLGGNLVIARGRRALELAEDDAEQPVEGPAVRRRFTSFSPEISLNFGHRNGWSYISGGMFGRSTLYLDRADAPASGVPQRTTINYGGGARWFVSDHAALSVDFRWYSVEEMAAGPGVVAQPRTTLLLLSGGISIR
jgi:hypothetical protein